jgi:3-dehydroquinate synthase
VTAPADVIVDVELGARSYPVHVVAALTRLGPLLRQRLPGARRALICGPAPVLGPWGEAACASLRAAGVEPVVVEHPDGEGAKQISVWEGMIDALLSHGLRRDEPLLALGGGVTGDLVGFCAATALRGVPLVQVPTSLLAMVDSSVGGKVGLNTRHGKNLVGAFYQPTLVVAPVACLATLPALHRSSGLGEILKHALLAGAPALAALDAAAPALQGGQAGAWVELIAAQVRFKAGVVARDEHELGERALLNLGHTVGHAVEAARGGALPHGICVALGLLAEAAWAAGAGLGPAALPAQLAQRFQALGIELPSLMIDAPTLFQYMAHDKKRARATLHVPIIGAEGGPLLAALDEAAVHDLARVSAQVLAAPLLAAPLLAASVLTDPLPTDPGAAPRGAPPLPPSAPPVAP